MKKIFKYALLATSLSIFSACEDPETTPLQRVTGDYMWDPNDLNGQLPQWFLFNLYNYLPDGFNRVNGDYLDAASGDAIPSRVNMPVENYTNGRVSVLNNPDPYWGNSYYGIRGVNIFLANIDNIKSDAVSAPSRIPWKSEARFIRAMLYFELLKRYGGVPLVGDKVFTLEDDLQIPRNTFEEVVNYIAAECDAIKGDLRLESAIPAGEWGRISKGAPIALKCRLFLYAASPLFNGGGTAANAELKALTGYPTYEANRWNRVIAAAEELKALNYYALNTSFAGLFTTKKNNEVILQKQRGNTSDLEQLNSPVGYQGQVTSNGRTSPTQNFVNAFTDINGLPISDPATLYKANDPYANRDPRFAATVFYNGTRWLNRGVETNDGGKDRPGGIAVQTRTGYYLRKFMADFTNSSVFSNQSHNYNLFRFAEILLNNAEALNETGETEKAVTEIIAIRRRAGIRAGTNNRYGIKAGITQSEMRSLIKNERRIELAFEEHRFWDLRRWKDAETVLNGPVQGVRIVKNADNTFSYTYENVANLIFTPKLYLMPLPYDEVTKNLRLLQNPGW
ncbi:RagB/SusD family nutrient uptake outer membrane protein [Rufibacter soli]|jgi:starch-binding outer membrane protein, SusD/RagB family